jgi:signal transduction histidine kinase
MPQPSVNGGPDHPALQELGLSHAQRLESVGRLAAGIAHEINTPIQFVGDSLYFLDDAFRDLCTLLKAYQTFRDEVATGAGAAAIARILEAEETSDLAYLLERIPVAVARAIDGVDRVSTIVTAMRDFAYPDALEPQPADLNGALKSTITVARGEFKHVATVETDFGVLPTVRCRIGDLNQVFLNLLINAAHAIEDTLRAGTVSRPGVITVRTRHEGGLVMIAVADTGAGIPEAIRERIFDPFFTSKEAGRGTGQGLAIARTLIEEGHGGRIWFETELGTGTTFYVELPVEGRAP